MRNSSNSVEPLPSGSSLGTGEKAFRTQNTVGLFCCLRRNGSQGFFCYGNLPGVLLPPKEIGVHSEVAPPEPTLLPSGSGSTKYLSIPAVRPVPIWLRSGCGRIWPVLHLMRSGSHSPIWKNLLCGCFVHSLPMHPGSFAAEKDFSVSCILCSLLSLSFAFILSFLHNFEYSYPLSRCAGASGGNSWPTLPYIRETRQAVFNLSASACSRS